MQGPEKERRKQYWVCKRLAKHTEQFDEALKYTMLANDALKGANEDWNLCGKRSTDLDFGVGVGDPNVTNDSS